MKNNKLHTSFTVLLLALMLVSRVGIHVFHHHNPLHSNEASKVSIVTGSLSVAASEAIDVDCLLCKLDSFQELFIEALIPFVFLTILWKPIYKGLFSTLVNFSIFSKSRGPPVAQIV